MEIGLISFGDRRLDPASGTRQPVADQLREQLERIRLAEQVGLSFYGLGEHHIEEYAISNPGTVLAAAATQTSSITLSTAVSVLSTDDPVRLYQQFTTLDQLSGGRAEIIAGRGSFTESFPLYGADLADYDALYDEKLELLIALDREQPLTWKGQYRPPLTDAVVLPRPFGERLRISVGTGGNPQSSARAGVLGLPVVYAIIGGEPERFAPLVDLYRRATLHAGHDESVQDVTMSAIGLVARDAADARDTFYPYWRQTMEYGARARGWTVPGRRDYDAWATGARAIFTGNPEQVAGRLIDVGRLTSADRYAMHMDWSGVPHDVVMTGIELLGTEVLPMVRAELG